MAKIEQPKLEDNEEAWLVYGDALQADGDPRGELVALHGAPERRDAYVDAHAEALFGSLAPHRASVEIGWRWCVPETVSLRIGASDDPAARMAALLASPIAADMRKLRIVGVPASDTDRIDLSPALAQLASLPATCTALELVDERARTSTRLVATFYDAGGNLVRFGTLDAVWAVKHLRSVSVNTADVQQITLGTIDAPALEQFELLPIFWAHVWDETSEHSQTLGAANWPSLRRLALRLPESATYSWPVQTGAYVRVEHYDEEAGEDYDDEGFTEPADWVAELAPILQSLARTQLETLALTDFTSSGELLAALQEEGLPPTLRHLDLSSSDVGDGDLPYFVQNRDTFAGLATIDLRGTLVTDPGPLRGLGPKILHAPGSGARYEFSVGSE